YAKTWHIESANNPWPGLLINAAGGDPELDALLGAKAAARDLEEGRGGIAERKLEARLITNTHGDILDPSRITIPQGKFGYLLNNPDKPGVFRDSLGFDQKSLDTALRQHLIDNFEGVSRPEPIIGGGVKVRVTGPLRIRA